jgi:hypothetical protein
MRLWPDLLLTGGREVSGHLVRVADGRIVAIEPATPADAAAPDVVPLPPGGHLPARGFRLRRDGPRPRPHPELSARLSR